MKCGRIKGIMAKKNNTKRKLVGLVSEESGVRAYYTKKNTMNTPDKLSLKKIVPPPKGGFLMYNSCYYED